MKKPKNVVVTGGSMTGVGYFNAGSSGGTSCVAFDFDDVGVITVTINWTTTGGGIAPTKIVYSGGANPNTPVPASGPYRIRLSAGGVKQAGSSFVPPATPHLVQIQTNLPSVCSSGTYSAFTIAGGAVAM